MKSYATANQAPVFETHATGRLDITRSFQSLIQLFLTWEMRARGRYELTQLDEFQLKDIGIDLIDAQNEAAKPFWRA